MQSIDLRSDTVTLPTPAMREAMAKADVGDDVYGEDPTINKLQDMAADIMGKEAGLYVPSGTMGNLAAILAHCNRGDEIILGNMAHIFLSEAGGISALGGVHPHTLPTQPDGTLKLEAIQAAIRPENVHMPVTRLVAIENTHSRCGGVPLSLEYTKAVADLVKQNDLIFHIDGARIFNAAAALDVDVKDLVAAADSVSFCLSKGLCAPVGSVICGGAGFIKKAHRIRKQLGGGMRQAGVLAAAGIVALEEVVPRLKDDHIRAANLAAGLARIPGIVFYTGKPLSNMVHISLDETLPTSAEEVANHLKEAGILVGRNGPRHYRLVTHYWIDDLAVTTTIRTFRSVLSKFT